MAIQLNHGGRVAKSTITGHQPVSPSPIAVAGGEIPRELAKAEIADIVACFARAAMRAKKAGFDGVEVHGAHGYLISQFLSPTSNKRNDEYGGQISNRARFLVEIVEAIRETVGPDYPVWCRIDGEEAGTASRITIPELQELSRIVEAAGVDAINVSGNPATRPMFSQPGFFVHFAEAVKQVVSVPVIVASRIGPEAGERILEDSKADFIGMGRGLIAEPELPLKARSSRVNEIAPCLRCLECTFALWKNEPVRCSVNAMVGHEREFSIKPAKKTRKVLVIGGGPAGMEAARVAALRGHEVILYEISGNLGGQLLVAGKPPYKEEVTNLSKYLTGEVNRLGVTLKMGEKADSATISQIKPDVVILAAGASPLIPQITGVNLPIVATANDVLSGIARVGERVIIIGGELVGCETAAFLAERGKRVTIVRRGAEMALKVKPKVREPLMGMLRGNGVVMLTGVGYDEIVNNGLVIRDKDGKRLLAADTVVLAAGAVPNQELFSMLKAASAESYTIGDCVEPRDILNAIHEGAAAGRRI